VNSLLEATSLYSSPFVGPLLCYALARFYSIRVSILHPNGQVVTAEPNGDSHTHTLEQSRQFFNSCHIWMAQIEGKLCRVVPYTQA
jgi:hypothetical protein